MPVLVLNANLAIKNFQLLNVAFYNMIQNENNILLDDLFTDELDFNINRVVLRAINYEAHVSKYVDAAELIAKNTDLEDKLMKIQ